MAAHEPPDESSHLLARQLRREQREREPSAVLLNLWLSAVAAVALQLTRTKDAKHWLLTSVVVVNAVVSAFILYETRRTRQLETSWVGVLAVLATTAALAATVQLGLLSPVAVLFPVIIFHHALADSPVVARLAYVWAAVGYLALAILGLTGVFPLTESVIALRQENPRAIVGFTILLEAVFFGTYVMARRNRRATRAVFDRLELATRQVAQGDALLIEAHADLRRALGGPKVGRWTGVELSGWVVGEVIGRGGMAEVYAARDPRSGATAAVKLLHPSSASDEAVVSRFLREATAAASLDSPHVLGVLLADRAPDGTPYLVTELLIGRDLATILREQTRLDAPATRELVMQLASGLEVARLAGVVHRDLKPNNVFRTQNEAGRPIWKILDFGVAAIMGENSDLTREGVVGTPGYMSPEQALGEPVDHRADVFALAVIAYRCLTGQPAFGAAEPISTLFQVVHQQPECPSLLVDLHPDVDRVLALGLAKKRDQRIETATAFARGFEQALRGELDRSLRDAADALILAEPWSSSKD